MRTFIWLMCFHWALGDTVSTEEELKSLDLRVKRQINALPLVYPYGGTYKLLIGITSPIRTDPFINLLFLCNFQYQYLQFQNISQLSQYYFIKQVSREQRDADLVSRRNERLVFYRAVADMMDSKGMNGQECVLRAICEAAQFPVEEEGIFGELIHVLLTGLVAGNNFVAFGVETLGPWGPSEQMLFKELSKRLVDITGDRGAGSFLAQRTSVAIQRDNAASILGTIPPDYGNTFKDLDPELKEDMSEYRDAAVAGRQMFSCPYIYSGCPEGRGVMELITTLRDE